MFLYLMILLLINDEGDSKSTTRVYNGYPDIYNQFPFVVCIETTAKTPDPIKFCTGSLIERNWVITAAHCLVHENVTVSYGNTISRQLAITVKVLNQIKHPQHKMIRNNEQWSVTNDVGLIEVENIPINSLGKLSTVNYKEFLKAPVVFAGYGFIWLQKTLDSADPARQIKAIDSIPLLVGQGETMECKLEVVWHPSICVYAEQEMRRIADHGGPLLHNGTILGIFSGGSGNTMVYVPVSFYLIWIRDVMIKYKKQEQQLRDSDKTNKDTSNLTINVAIEIGF